MNLKLNKLPERTVDLRGVAKACPSPRGRLAMQAMCVDEVARTMLRRVMPSASRGTPAGKQYEAIVREAAGYRNIEIGVRADYYHKVFTRLKSNMAEVRMIVDGTCSGDVNAANQRLPRPPPPPAMMRVTVVIRVLLSGAVFGVDDVRTAFATMPLCETMQRAHGVAVFTRAGGVIRGVSTRVIQGGTWSACVCQYHTLTVVLDEEHMPQRETADYSKPADLVNSRRVGVNFVGACLLARRLVHVDDVMSGGVDARALDAKRRSFRERAERKWGVQWKDFVPSGPRGRAVGIELDCEHKMWGVCTAWYEELARALYDIADADWDAHVEEWFRGVTAWIVQVVHVPAMLPVWSMESGDKRAAVEAAVAMAQSRVALPWWARERDLEQIMKPWPRPGRLGGAAYSISDASKIGWAAARTDGTSRCGNWYWCREKHVPTTVPCCGGDTPIHMESADIYLGEAMASVENVWDWDTDGADALIVTDSKIWVDVALSCAGSTDRTVTALLLVLVLTASGERAIAHCNGHGEGANYADGPSQEIRRFSVVGLPPPASTGVPRWTVAGGATHARAVRRLMRAAALQRLPCVWRQRLERVE